MGFPEIFGSLFEPSDEELIKDYKVACEGWGKNSSQARKFLGVIQERIVSLQSKFKKRAEEITELKDDITKNGIKHANYSKNKQQSEILLTKQKKVSVRITVLQVAIGALKTKCDKIIRKIQCLINPEWYYTLKIKDGIIIDVLYVYEPHQVNKAETHFHAYTEEGSDNKYWHAKKRGMILFGCRRNDYWNVVYYDRFGNIIKDFNLIQKATNGDNMRIFNSVLSTWLNNYVPMLGKKY